jgi:hypothetical protein
MKNSSSRKTLQSNIIQNNNINSLENINFTTGRKTDMASQPQYYPQNEQIQTLILNSNSGSLNHQRSRASPF